MKKGVLKQGTIWFRSRLLIQDPKNSQSLPRPLDGSDFLLSLPLTSHWETEDWARQGQPKGKSVEGRQENKKMNYRQVCATSLSPGSLFPSNPEHKG